MNSRWGRLLICLPCAPRGRWEDLRSKKGKNGQTVWQRERERAEWGSHPCEHPPQEHLCLPRSIHGWRVAVPLVSYVKTLLQTLNWIHWLALWWSTVTMAICSRRYRGTKAIRVGSTRKTFGEFLFKPSEDWEYSIRIRFSTVTWSQPTFFWIKTAPPSLETWTYRKSLKRDYSTPRQVPRTTRPLKFGVTSPTIPSPIFGLSAAFYTNQ